MECKEKQMVIEYKKVFVNHAVICKYIIKKR